MWNLLGFTESPYDTRPLAPVAADMGMLVARTSEATEFLTTLDSRSDGVAIISGAPGVGKTSFLNVQQYRMAHGLSLYGPKVLPAYMLTPINPGDDALDVARRVVQNLVKSIERHCDELSLAIPEQTGKIRKWVSAHGASGFDIGLQIFGCGGNIARSTEVPALSDATFERLHEVISALVSEAVKELGVDSVIVVLDNIENLENEELQRLLMTFRDTIFTSPDVWWVLIGQSGLGSLVRELDPRIADRMEGVGLELKPISVDDLHKAVELRVQKFSNRGGGQAPIPRSVHKLLYDASNKEIRFAFKYANTICTRYVKSMRDQAMVIVEAGRANGKFANLHRNDIDEVIGDLVVEKPLEVDYAEEILKQIATDELQVSALSRKELQVLHAIGEKGAARGKDHDHFGVSSNQQFSSRFLVPLRERQLLARKQEGRGVIYTLRGLAALGYKYSLLDAGPAAAGAGADIDSGEDD